MAEQEAKRVTSEENVQKIKNQLKPIEVRSSGNQGWMGRGLGDMALDFNSRGGSIRCAI